MLYFACFRLLSIILMGNVIEGHGIDMISTSYWRQNHKLTASSFVCLSAAICQHINGENQWNIFVFALWDFVVLFTLLINCGTVYCAFFRILLIYCVRIGTRIKNQDDGLHVRPQQSSIHNIQYMKYIWCFVPLSHNGKVFVKHGLF